MPQLKPLPQSPSARFVTGNTLRHVIMMTMTNSVGLMALFLVDLIDLYFLNMLNAHTMAAAVGFATQLLFFVSAISIGLLIAIGVLVSQRIGARDPEGGKQIIATAAVIGALMMTGLSGLLLYFLDPILHRFGATGETFTLARTYAQILLPSSTILVLSMIFNAVLRAVGDAKRSMNATLIAAFVNLFFDPIFIFYLDGGIAGAAWSSVLSRFAMLAYGVYIAHRYYQMLSRPTWQGMKNSIAPLFKVAVPAMMTNLATPVGTTFVMTTMARYGDAAMAAYTTIGRMTPVVFSVLFALSGAISPIIGQNYGARLFSRVKAVYRDAIGFSIFVVVSVSIVLILCKSLVLSIFKLSGEAASLLAFYCSGLTLFFIADGIIFCTNAVFNSLGYPLYSTCFNYAKFFLGIIPAVFLLSSFYGPTGVLVGQAIGPLWIMLIAVLTCRHLIHKISLLKDNDVVANT